MNIWSQTRHGRAFDLIDPDPAMVNFREIALQLAYINRYAGAALVPVSVAFHTLIAADNAAPSLKPYVLLHDAHEFVIGDIPTPAAQALFALAAPHALYVRAALERLKRGVDLAVWRAAGLPPPDERTEAEIRHADRIALMTERRDFLAAPPRPWGPELEAIAPARRVYRAGAFGRTADDVADRLMAEFHAWLPVFNGRPSPSGAAAQPQEHA